MKKSVLKKCLTIALLCILSLSCFAQQSAYQKRMNQIARKYYPILLGRQLSAVEMNTLLSMGSVEKGIQSMFVVYMRSHTNSQVKALAARLDAEFNAAKKLMTKAEKDAIVAAQKAAEEARLKEAFQQTDLGILATNCAELCKKWVQKDEYETSDDYNHRIENESKEQFNEICEEVWQKYKDQINNRNSKIRIGNYDADKQQFPIHCTFYGANDDEIKTTVYINIPVSNARNFKESWIDDNIEEIYSYGTINFIIFPTKIKTGGMVINIDIQDATKITISPEMFFDMESECFEGCEYKCE